MHVFASRPLIYLSLYRKTRAVASLPGGAMALGALFDSEVRCERIRPSLAIPGKGWPHKLQHLSQKLILAVAMQEEGAASQASPRADPINAEV